MERMDWRELRREVEAELSGIEGSRLLEELRVASKIVRPAQGWREAFELIRRLGTDHTDHDAVLRWLFERARTDAAHAAEMALLGLFHPVLEALHRRKASWESDPEVRWGDVLWAFFRAIRRFSPERRGERIAGKIYGDTFHDFHRECQNRWTSSEREQVHDPLVLNEMADQAAVDGANGSGDAAPPERDDLLHRCRRAGVIDDVELALLSHIYSEDLSVKAAATKVGIGYEAAKKRKQRAETAIAEVVKNNF